MKKRHPSKRTQLSLEIKDCLNAIRIRQGLSLEALSRHLEINVLTLRNALSRGYWSDMAVTILKLKGAIPEDLAEEYKTSIELDKTERRKRRSNG